MCSGAAASAVGGRIVAFMVSVFIAEKTGPFFGSSDFVPVIVEVPSVFIAESGTEYL